MSPWAGSVSPLFQCSHSVLESATYVSLVFRPCQLVGRALAVESLGAFVCSCCGSMLPFYYSLLLLILALPYTTSAVCSVCANNACDGSNPANCPWATTVASNATALATGTAIVLTSLLPIKVLRLFPRSALDAIAALCNRNNDVLSLSDTTTFNDILAAVKTGRLSRADAIAHVSSQGAGLPNDATDNAFARIQFQIKALESVPKSLNNSSSSVEGARLYVLFKLSSAICSSRRSTVCFDCDTPESSDSSASSGKAYSAQMVRPSSEFQMFSLLNLFVAVCHATGLSNVLAITAFLEDVVYEPVRSGVLSWPVAFECVVIYLRMLEAQASGSIYTISNIHSRAGGIDAVRSEATAVAKDLYPAAFFRSHGGKPFVKSPDDTLKDTSGGKEFKGQVKGDTPGAKYCCIAWNRGTPHLAKHVSADGICKFKHACNRRVKDKGPNGRCLGDHTADKCDYDPAQLLDETSNGQRN